MSNPEDQAKSRVSPISGTAPPVEHQFKPGQSGNPGGKPKGRSLRALLREALDEVDEGGKSNGRKLVEALMDLALKDKSLGAIRDVFDQVEGKIPGADPDPKDDEKPKRINILGADGRPQ